MKYPVVLTPLANEDFLEALKWYDSQQEHLEKRFYNAVRETIELISAHPKLFSAREKGVRVAITKAFPFLVYYKIEEQRQRIVVLAILHQSRNPKIWKKR